MGKKKNKLSERQKRAADFFIELGNKSQALLKAGYSKISFSIFENDIVKEYI